MLPDAPPADRTDAPRADGTAPPPAGGTVRTFPANAVHLVRTTQLSHAVLSQMADQKASILMGASFLAFSLTVTQAGQGTLTLPLAVLAVFSFLSAVFSTLSVLPSTPRGPAGVNLLFFGSFARLDEDDYVERLLTTLGTEESMYDAMARDVHRNGQALARRRYPMLRLAYRCFLLGLTLSLVALVAQLAGLLP